MNEKHPVHVYSCHPHVVFKCEKCQDLYYIKDGASAPRVAARLRAFSESHRKSCGNKSNE